MQTEDFIARRFFEHEYIAGKASDWIESFNLNSRDSVLLINRVSNRERRLNLKDQNANLHEIVAPTNAVVVGYVENAVSGFDPCWLRGAACKAKRLGATILLAETADRFLRNSRYHSIKRPDLQPTIEQLRELAECTYGMRLMTHLHPDATPGEVRSYQSKRGQKYKNRRGGRPPAKLPGYMTERFEEKIERVLELHQFDYSLNSIAELVHVPRSTVHEWIIKYC